MRMGPGRASFFPMDSQRAICSVAGMTFPKLSTHIFHVTNVYAERRNANVRYCIVSCTPRESWRALPGAVRRRGSTASIHIFP